MVLLLLAGCTATVPEPNDDPAATEPDTTEEANPPRSMTFEAPVEVGWAPLAAEPLIRANDTHAVIVNIGAVWTTADGASWKAAADDVCPTYPYPVIVCPPGRGTPQTNAEGLGDDELLWDGQSWYRIGLGGGFVAPLQRAKPDLSSFEPAVETLSGLADRPWGSTNPWLVVALDSNQGLKFATSEDGREWSAPKLLDAWGSAGQLTQTADGVAFAFGRSSGDMVGVAEWADGEWSHANVRLNVTSSLGPYPTATSFPALGVHRDTAFLAVTADMRPIRTSSGTGSSRLAIAYGPDFMSLGPANIMPGVDGAAMWPWTHDLGDAVAMTWLQAPLDLPVNVPQEWHIMYAEFNGTWSEPIDVLGRPAFVAAHCPIGMPSHPCKLGTGGPVDFFSMTSLEGRPIIAYAIPGERSSLIYSVAMS